MNEQLKGGLHENNKGANMENCAEYDNNDYI